MKEGSKKNIVFVGTFDTKGAEAEYLKAFPRRTGFYRHNH